MLRPIHTEPNRKRKWYFLWGLWFILRYFCLSFDLFRFHSHFRLVWIGSFMFIYTERTRMRIVFFDLCRCSMWTLWTHLEAMSPTISRLYKRTVKAWRRTSGRCDVGTVLSNVPDWGCGELCTPLGSDPEIILLPSSSDGYLKLKSTSVKSKLKNSFAMSVVVSRWHPAHWYVWRSWRPSQSKAIAHKAHTSSKTTTEYITE